MIIEESDRQKVIDEIVASREPILQTFVPSIIAVAFIPRAAECFSTNSVDWSPVTLACYRGLRYNSFRF